MPNKVIGILLLVAAIVILVLFPFCTYDVGVIRKSTGKVMHKVMFVLFIVNCVVLAYLGAQSIE